MDVKPDLLPIIPPYNIDLSRLWSKTALRALIAHPPDLFLDFLSVITGNVSHMANSSK
jgi:hypothetical protein